jgi:PspA-Associated protein
VIVRIATEGQYEVLGSDEQMLHELDEQAVAACDGEDEQQFHEKFARLLEFVRSKGKQVPEDRLAPSDLILPPPDISLEEARAEFTGEGLIPS